MLDLFRYFLEILGLCFFLLCAFFTVVGSLAYARQWRSDRAYDREHYARQRTPGMGDLRSVPEQGVGTVWDHRYECEWEQRR